MEILPSAPELQVARWFNTGAPITLAGLRGKVVLVHAFQMLCPGCVTHAIPQAIRLHALAEPDDLAVLGLHTVFEHHAAMTPVALEAFLHEYRISFPVGVDQPATARGPAADDDGGLWHAWNADDSDLRPVRPAGAAFVRR